VPDNTGTKSTPGSVGVAAQLVGIPLDAVPSAKTSTRPPVSSGMTAACAPPRCRIPRRPGATRHRPARRSCR
jgi:hypothetical protein